MKKTVKLAVVAALALGSTSAFATNGSTMIGFGAKTRGMAGTGIGISHGAESALVNPALITATGSSEVSFGGTLFMPHVKTDTGSGEMESTADTFMIPTVSIAAKATEDLYIGMGMWGTSGMGVDYREEANNGNMNMVTNLMIMQFGVPVAYKLGGLSVAVTPLVQWGMLDINYNMADPLVIDITGKPSTTGAGMAQDLQLGYNVGLAYTYGALTIGAVYKSQIDMEYKQQLNSATAPFAKFGIFDAPMSDELSTPAEMGAGFSFNTRNHSFAFDYKKILWSDAKGYDTFNWEDQTVYAVGYEFHTDGWAVRAGYNYGKMPINAMENANAGGQLAGGMNSGNAINTFNMLGFPATVEQHFGLGASFHIGENTSFDLAATYAPEVSTTMSGMNPASLTFDSYDVTTKHNQMAATGQVTFNF